MLIFADGFAFYGTSATSRTNIIQGVWSQIDTGSQCATTNPRGNGTHHLRISGTNQTVRRAFGATHQTFGMGAAFYFANLPVADARSILFQLRDGSNLNQFTLTLTTTGAIQVRNGGETGTILGTSADLAVTAGAYNHIEFVVDCQNAGSIEIRVNGVTVLDIGPVDLQAQASPGAAQVRLGHVAADPPVMDIADMHAFDLTGGVNNDFLGDVEWLPRYPSADTATTDWTRNTGSNDFEAIDDVTPDGDTTYVEATAAGQVSIYEVTDVPANTSDIIAVVTQPMVRKTDAGSGSLQTSLISTLVSPDQESNGDDHALTEAYTYYPDNHDVDPATGVRWTVAAFNALRLQIDRTA